MAKTNRRSEVIDAFAGSNDTEKSPDADIREAKKIKITDPAAVEQMKKVLAIRKRMNEYVEANLEPLTRQLKKHQLRATGIRSEESVHSMDFWDRLHELGLIDQTSDVSWSFDFEEREDGTLDVWIGEASKEKSQHVPEIIKYLLKALGAEGSFDDGEE